MAKDQSQSNWWENVPAYVLAYEDIDLLNRDDLRSVRLMLEYFKPELILEKNNIKSTIVVFGSARIISPEEAENKLNQAKADLEKDPGNKTLAQKARIAGKLLEKSEYYEEARKFGQIVSHAAQTPIRREFVISTGGGPGIMEAANRGAHEANAVSIGFNITLPHEQFPNDYITPEFCFRFRYFSIRKLHFLLRAKALVTFPGGYGTLDELFDALTLIQTGKMHPIPIILVGEKFWKSMVSFDNLVAEGMISPEDVNLFHYAETAEETWQIIKNFYKNEVIFSLG